MFFFYLKKDKTYKHCEQYTKKHFDLCSQGCYHYYSVDLVLQASQVLGRNAYGTQNTVCNFF